MSRQLTPGFASLGVRTPTNLHISTLILRCCLCVVAASTSALIAPLHYAPTSAALGGQGTTRSTL